MHVIVLAKPRVRLTAETAIALSQHGTVSPSHVFDRSEYAGAMHYGLTAPEINVKGHAAREIADLNSYIASRLYRETAHAAPAFAQSA